jgi:hypothetical protein
MCSQCFRKYQEDAGLIERKPSPKPAPEESDEQELERERRAVAEIESSPLMRACIEHDPNLRAQFMALKAKVAHDMIARPRTATANVMAQDNSDDDDKGFLQNAAFARQLQMHMANQNKLASMHLAQEKASRAAQLPPNLLEAAAKPGAKQSAVAVNNSDEPKTINHGGAKIGCNDKCPCESRRKYKACHGKDMK